MGSARPVVCIVTPGTRSANNGNWRTAARWAEMLREKFKVIVQTEWDGTCAQAMVALHAYRSAGSIARFRQRFPDHGLAVMLTGTDLYGELGRTPQAEASLAAASRIVVLQEDARGRLAPRLRARTQVIFQSAQPLPRKAKSKEFFRCVAVGHLRAVKDPATLFAAVRLLPPRLPIEVHHFGEPLDAALGEEAAALQAHDPRYRYLGGRPHARVRAAIQAAHVLVHPSLAEGGANVIAEAVTAGTPVIASRIAGNIGMLGKGYAGYFEAGDAAGLAKLLRRAQQESAFLRSLWRQCAQRRPLFRPASEARAVRRLVTELVKGAA